MASMVSLNGATLTERSAVPPSGWAEQDIALSERTVMRAEAAPSVPPPALRIGLQRVWELRTLPYGWNSFAAKPATRESVEAAADLLSRFLSPGIPPPAAVPRVQGGLQLEWHAGAGDVEIYIEPAGEVSFYCEGPGEPFEGELQGNEAKLARCLRQLG